MTGRLDAFEWKDPLAELEPAGAVIESDGKERPLLDARASVATSATAAPELRPAEPDATVRVARRRPRVTPPLQPAIEKVIPLVHVPDDPGPDPEPHTDPETEPSAEAQPDAWQKLRGLFR